MSSRKLDFKTWRNDIGIRECDQTTKCDDCKAAWDFAEAQEKREYELLESEHSELLANFCKVDMERIKLSMEVEELKKKVGELEKEGFALSANQCCAEDCGIHFQEGTSLFCKHEQKNKALKKKLGEAVEVIRFYGNPESWIKRHKDSWDKCSPKNFGDEETIFDYAHPKTDWVGTVAVGGRKARAFLKENKDE